MGIFLDTVEDNDEWKGQIKDKIIGSYHLVKSKVSTYKCLCCEKRFFSESDLQDHIFEIHRVDSNNHLINQNKLNKFTENITDYADLDQLFWDLQSKISCGEKINNWDKYKKEYIHYHEDSLRQNYLKGILEYLSSHYQEIQYGQNSNNQITSAYGYLQSLAPKIRIAKQICCAIAFKLNWFDELAILSEYSLFSLAGHFFTQPYEIVKSTNISLNKKLFVSFQQNQGIIIDEFHHEILKLLESYYCERSSVSIRSIEKIEDLIKDIYNPNYVNKIILIKARFFRDCKDFEQARKNYRIIRNDPVFGKESCLFRV